MNRFSLSKTMQRVFPVFMIFISMSRINCQESRPSWVDTLPNHPDLFQAVGISGDTGDKDGDILRADNFAISQIIQEISVTVSTDIRQFYKEDSRDGIAETSQIFTYLSEQYAKETIRGITVKARYFDKKSKNYYSYAVLSRADLEKQFQEKAENAIKMCQDYHTHAQDALDKKLIYDALHNYTRALKELFIVQASLKKQIHGNLLAGAPEEVLQVQLENQISAIVRNFEFRILSGDKQRAERSRGLNEPLVGSVYYEGNPVSNIPLTVFFTNATGLISKNVTTNSHGIFQAVVETIESSKAGTGQIMAVLYFPDIEPFKNEIQSLYNQIESNHALFTFHIDVAASIKLFIHIIEITNDELISKMTVTPEILRALIAKKYSVYDIKRLANKVSQDDLAWAIQYNDMTTITNALKTHCDYAITGTVTIRHGDVSSGVLYFSYCDAEVHILNLDNGRIVGNSVISGVRGAGNNFETAGQRALQECLITLQQDIISNLDNALK